MSIQTNLHGRLRNTSLSRGHGLMPLFEAVVNSIHSIEEAGIPLKNGKISIEILRALPQPSLIQDRVKPGASPTEEILGFQIVDNGVGFNDANMRSFETLDSEHKVSKGCRGVGRLLWLKAFHRISIHSVFKDGVSFKSRSFTFNADQGVEEDWLKEEGKASKTTVHLDGFYEKYRSVAPKTAKTIANNLFEHCLWYFVRVGGAPSITVVDAGTSIHLDDVCDEYMHEAASSESLTIKDQKFELTHVKLRASPSQSHFLAFCAANRLVKEESLLGKIPGLYGKVQDEDGEFIYACYVSSAFLDEKVRPERTGFDIEDTVDGLFADLEISLKEIRDAITEKASSYLGNYLIEAKQAGTERVQTYVARKAPRYRPVLDRMLQAGLSIDPGISDKDLELVLHKHLSEIESKLLVDGHEVMVLADNENATTYRERLSDYLKAADEIKQSDLAGYVFHRKTILDLLERSIQKDSSGKYAREELIHELIMPLRKSSNEVMPDACNLWLVDERLAFHEFLASDKPLSSMPIISSTETKEPDIVALNVYDEPLLVAEGTRLPLASIVVLEIKRPMRNDAAAGEDSDPVEQALGYLARIRAGRVKTAMGRPIPESEEVPGYCYVICDITSSVQHRCKVLNLTPTSDHLGYFGYNSNFKAYIEVISFDRLLNSAKERNRAFFDKLGLPTS